MLLPRSFHRWLMVAIAASAMTLGSCTDSPSGDSAADPDPEPTPTETVETPADEAEPDTPQAEDDADPDAGTEDPGEAIAPANAPNNAPKFDPDVTVSTTDAAVYWLDTDSNTLELVEAPLETTAKSEANLDIVLTAALEALLDGPDAETHSTTIPTSTRLEGVEVKNDGVHINLSTDFTSGGGTMSMTGRVAQILYTASSIDADTPVWLSVDSEPLEVLGGEGLLIRQPLTRDAFEEDFQ